jgi:hypothetical protein
MLETVKEEYRDKVDTLYNEIMSSLRDTYSYIKSDDGTESVDETSVMAYSEIITQLYNGKASIGRRNSRGVRRVKFLDNENRIHYIFEPNTHWNNTLEVSTVTNNAYEWGDKFNVSYPLSEEMNDNFVEYLELCYEARNKVQFQKPENLKRDPSFKGFGDDFFSYYTKTVRNLQRNRKINSLFS